MSRYSGMGDCFRELSAMLHSSLLYAVPIMKSNPICAQAAADVSAIRRFTRLGMWERLRNRDILDKEMLRNDIRMVKVRLPLVFCCSPVAEIWPLTVSPPHPWF